MKSPHASKCKGRRARMALRRDRCAREKTGIFRGRREALSRDSKIAL